jgi:hypothetical protein
MTRTRILKFLPLATLCASAATLAAPPATSPYATDPVSEYVQDETAQGIGSLNMVLCVIGSTDPGDMVNLGPYVALVDVDKCQNKGGGSSAASAGATNYANAVVNVTRASNSDPMIAKVWLSLTQQGNATTVYAYLSATQSPTDAPPYGVFRLDYIGKMGGQVGFNGYIDSQPGSISFLETGQQSSSTKLTMTATSTTAGSGTMYLGGNGGGGGGGSPTTFNFAYNPGYFHRDDGTHDECFDRSKANASTLVWQYGTYNANDGTRVDQAHPGIPVLATYLGTSYYGFANYWGINFQGLNIPDGSPVAGLTVTDQRPGNTTTYALNKVGGKLTKWTQVATTLAALDGIPFTYGADLSAITAPPVNSGWNNWVLQWSTTNQNFTVIGTQTCGSNGCVDAMLSSPSVITATAFNAAPISGWANSFGGNINIPPTGAPHAAADPVYYYNQSTVIPGSTSLTLYCLNQCPTTAQLGLFAVGTSSTTPYGNTTDQQWFSAPGPANTVTYTFGASGLVESGSPVILEQASQFPSGSQYAQNGIQTGWLLDTPLTFANCGAGYSSPTVCQPANPTTYYTWQTGVQQWNQSLWLSTGGTVVPFDPPQNIAYTVPSGAAYGTYSALPILLQFNGFGNLNGIPGSCVDPVSNVAEDCSISGASYAPSFSIPDGTTLTLPSISGSTTTPLIVKALNGEILLKSLGSGASACSAMTLTPLTLPSGGTHDPSNSADSEYLGAVPTPASVTPKVIDGVLQ